MKKIEDAGFFIGRSQIFLLNKLNNLALTAEGANNGVDTDWIRSASGGQEPPQTSLNEVKEIAENTEDQSGWKMFPSDYPVKKIEDAVLLSLDSPKFTSTTKCNNFSFDHKSRKYFDFPNKHSENYHQICWGKLYLWMHQHQQYCPDWLPKSTKMLLDMISAAWGTSVYPLLPELIVSTDYTTEHIWRNKGQATKVCPGK